ncbi:MAG TPA: HGxxPAAW family protein [Streptosporangiaceae bacterium]|nr:HGxxPAAW family protein [Streptosporangiaceae bacterium]
MTDGVGTDVESGARPDEAQVSAEATAGAGQYEPFHGRPVSWVAVALIVAGFLAGGLALVFGPVWWLFWAGLGLAVVGALVGLSTNIFEDWY